MRTALLDGGVKSISQSSNSTARARADALWNMNTLIVLVNVWEDKYEKDNISLRLFVHYSIMAA